jgi:hypothetical protein
VVVALLWVVLPLARAGEAEKPVRIAEVLPEGTILMVESAPWSYWAADFDKTALAQIAREPEVQKFLEGPLNQLATLFTRPGAGAPPPEAKAPPGGPQGGAAKAVQALFEMLGSMAGGPFSVAVRYSPDDAQAKKAPAVLLMLGVQGSKDAQTRQNTLGDMLDKLLTQFNIQAVGVAEYQNTKVLSLSVADGGARKSIGALTLFKGRLLVSTDLEMCKQVMDGLAGTLGKSLAESQPYKSSGLSGDEHLVAYLDVAGLRQALGTGEAGAGKEMDSFLVRAGLDKATAVAWSLKMSGAAFESRTAIFSQGERAGLLGALAEEPVSAAALKLCPKGTPLAIGLRLKADSAAPLARALFLTLLGDKAAADFDAAAKAKGEVFGDEFVLTSVAGMENVGPIGDVSAFVASLSVKDAGKTGEFLDDLLSRAAKTNGTPDAVKDVMHGDVKIRYLATSAVGGLVKISPSFGIAGDRLVVALDVPTLKRALGVIKDGPALMDVPAYQQALAATGAKMGPAFTYVDWGYLYKSVFNMGAETLKLVAPAEMLKQAGIDINLLPTTDSVAKHLFPGLSVAQISKNSIVMVSRSPLPSMEVIVPPATAVSAIFASLKPFGAEAGKK